MDTFSTGACIRFGWETFKKRPWFLVGSMVLFYIVVGLVSWALVEVSLLNAPTAIVATIVRIVFEMLAVMGLLAFSIKAHDSIEAASLRDFWHPQDFWKFIGSIIVQVLLVIAGLIALVIPGIVLSVSTRFSPFFVIDKHEGPVESIFSSVRITRNKKWAVFQFLATTLVLAIAGVFALLVGTFVTLPIILLASVHAYRTLSQEA